VPSEHRAAPEMAAPAGGAGRGRAPPEDRALALPQPPRSHGAHGSGSGYNRGRGGSGGGGGGGGHSSAPSLQAPTSGIALGGGGEIEEEWTSIAAFKVMRELGQGSFGVALLVEERATGLLYVIKRINISALGQRERRAALGEVEVLSRLRHPNIIGYYGSFVEASHLHIVLEYADGGDLAQAIKEARGGGKHFSEARILFWFCQLSSALQYVHGARVLHRDLKASNIFLQGADKVVKLADFGIARVLADASMASTTIGTP
jgi:serine/threonine protein kinase